LEPIELVLSSVNDAVIRSACSEVDIDNDVMAGGLTVKLVNRHVPIGLLRLRRSDGSVRELEGQLANRKP
jgi:hypothetical protein